MREDGIGNALLSKEKSKEQNAKQNIWKHPPVVWGKFHNYVRTDT